MRKKEEFQDIWIACSVGGTRSYRIHTDPGRTLSEILELLRVGAAQVDIDSIHTEIEGRRVRLARVVEMIEEVVPEDWRETEEKTLPKSQHEHQWEETL